MGGAASVGEDKTSTLLDPKSALVDKTRMNDSILDNYDDLIEFLTKDCSTGLEKLCNIFAFLGLCGVKERNLDSPLDKGWERSNIAATDGGALPDSAGTPASARLPETVSSPGIAHSGSDAEQGHTESPRGYMRSIQGGVGRYAFFFTILCRKAKLPCVLIPGVAKSAIYDVGDTDVTKLRNVWTAVYIDGDWRFVHPLWAIKTLSGYSSKSWYLVDTSGNITVNDAEKSSGEETQYRVNTFWFLTDPDQFINWCLPDDRRWQLLDKPLEKIEFLQQLYRREAFFKFGITVDSHDYCNIVSTSGFAEIILRIPKSKTSFVIMHDLFRKALHNQSQSTDNIEKHCVAMIKELPLVKFKVRFPVADSFVLNIFGSDVGASETLEWLCSFRLDCTRAMNPYLAYPDSPYSGWGPGFETEAAGLKPLTHPGGLVVTTTEEPISFGFRLLKNVSVIADLLDQSEQYVPVVVTVGKSNVKVIASLPPVNREYGLAIYTKNTADGTVRNAVNYIIRRNLPSDDETTSYFEQHEECAGNDEAGGGKWKKMQRKVIVQDESSRTLKMKMKLARASTEEDVYELEQAIQTYESCDLGPCMELTMAQKQLAFLQRKRALQKAIKLKQTSDLEQAIQDIKDHDERKKISSVLIKTAESLLIRLQLLDRSRQRVTDMNNRSVSEVRRYNRAVDTVHDVAAAVYALLGENPEKLEKWKYVQSLLGRDGPFSVIHLVETCTVSELTEERVEASKAFLGDHTLNSCRVVSTEIAVFFQWVTSMIDNYTSNRSEREPAEELARGMPPSHDVNGLQTPSPT